MTRIGHTILEDHFQTLACKDSDEEEQAEGEDEIEIAESGGTSQNYSTDEFDESLIADSSQTDDGIEDVDLRSPHTRIDFFLSRFIP